MRQQSIALQACEPDDLPRALPDAGELTGLSDEASLKPLPARFMLHDGREASCEIIDLNSDGAVFLSGEPVCDGASLVAYIEGLGRVEGIAGDASNGGFRVHFSLTGPRRLRLEQNLRWLRLRQHGLASEERNGTRFAPNAGTARVTLGNGEEHGCEVLDISLSGAAIRCAARPEPGSCVLLGRTRGRVIRHLADGFAIEFMTALEQADLHHSLR